MNLELNLKLELQKIWARQWITLVRKIGIVNWAVQMFTKQETAIILW